MKWAASQPIYVYMALKQCATSKMNQHPTIWQWPNALAIDAALIAVAWQAALVQTLHLSIGAFAYVVLGLSVWLTYMADRLFDVARRDPKDLLSLRHQLAKRHTKPLWSIWLVVLAANLLFATQLNNAQFRQGAVLLLACLAYTLLNQKLSHRFFPKELCVAIIYAGGVSVFLPTDSISIGFVAAFAFLCFLNCLVIGTKEKEIDTKMRVLSVAPFISEKWLTPIAVSSTVIVFWIHYDLHFMLGLGFGQLSVLHWL
jgi:hypothetical protein